MKWLPKFGLLALLIGLFVLAIFLPSLVQKNEPPTTEEDLAAALAAVDLSDEGVAPEVDPPAANPLRKESRFANFFAAVEEQDFQGASDELVSLSGKIDSETMESLTSEMEQAIVEMGEPEAREFTEVAAKDTLPPLSLEAEPVDAAKEPAKSVVVAEPDPARMVAFFSTVQGGDFTAADRMLTEMSEEMDESSILMLQTTLSNAKKDAKELEESKKQLAASRERLAKIQEESVSQIQASVKELAAVTKAAREATAEASRMRKEMASAAAQPAPPEPAKPKPKPVELPDQIAVNFGFDSTYLNQESKSKLENAVAALQTEKRLSTQLRGHADASGSSEYNGIIARARCEVVKDHLVASGIDESRIEIISFGETQAASTGGSAEDLRRVDLIFRK